MSEETYWNGEPCEARKVTITVADAPEFPLYWARDLVGERRNATEVTYAGETFYLDDEIAGDDLDEHGHSQGLEIGWRKVTLGRGLPQYRHRNLNAEPGSVEPR